MRVVFEPFHAYNKTDAMLVVFSQKERPSSLKGYVNVYSPFKGSVDSSISYINSVCHKPQTKAEKDLAKAFLSHYKRNTSQ